MEWWRSEPDPPSRGEAERDRVLDEVDQMWGRWCVENDVDPESSQADEMYERIWNRLVSVTEIEREQ